MNNKAITLILAVFGVILLILIIATSLTSISLRKKNEPTPTPILTSPSDSTSENTDSQQALTAQQEEQIYQAFLDDPDNDLTLSEKQLLDKLKAELPISTEDFDIVYSPDINRFVISKKTDKADAAIRSFLQSKGLLGLYSKGWGGFLVTNKPTNEAISEFKQDVRAGIEDENTDTKKKKKSKNPNGKSKKTKDEKLLTDFGETMLSFDFTKKEEPQQSDSSSPDINGVTCPPNLGGPNAQGYYQMPPATRGEYVFSNPSCGGQHYGKKELVCTLYTVALAWMKKYPDSRARIGDLNATGHKSHKWGVAVDFTITNASAANTSGDRARSIELGKMFVATGQIKNIWFNDTAVDAAVISFARQNNLPLTAMHPIEGHDDHFHVDVNAPRGPVSEPGC